eukprot:406475_1
MKSLQSLFNFGWLTSDDDDGQGYFINSNNMIPIDQNTTIEFCKTIFTKYPICNHNIMMNKWDNNNANNNIFIYGYFIHPFDFNYYPFINKKKNKKKIVSEKKKTHTQFL